MLRLGNLSTLPSKEKRDSSARGAPRFIVTGMKRASHLVNGEASWRFLPLNMIVFLEGELQLGHRVCVL
jgi:hypothetical protein